MSFEIKQKTKVEVSLYGQQFDLSKPTVSQVEQLQRFSNLEGMGEGEKMQAIVDFLDVLGLPKDFAMQMEIDHLIQLITYLTGEMGFDKKKSEAGH